MQRSDSFDIPAQPERTNPTTSPGYRQGSRFFTDPLFKRPFDLVFAALALIMTLPFWAIIAVAIWVEDQGPVFFRQERIGRYGKRICLLKFRSMVHDPNTVERQASRNDPRITRVGRALRRTALDELPQLWNILLGDMSFVGPRAQPEREIVTLEGRDHEVVVRALPGFELRQRVRPGLTGVTQLFAPREVPHSQKFRYDLIYVRRQLRHAALKKLVASERSWIARVSGTAHVLAGDLGLLWLDIRLMMRSVWVALLGKWEV